MFLNQLILPKKYKYFFFCSRFIVVIRDTLYIASRMARKCCSSPQLRVLFETGVDLGLVEGEKLLGCFIKKIQKINFLVCIIFLFFMYFNTGGSRKPNSFHFVSRILKDFGTPVLMSLIGTCSMVNKMRVRPYFIYLFIVVRVSLS